MKSRGFSLIELAIVLVIVTLLIGGLAVPLSAQIQARRVAETNKTLEAAQEAIIGYAITHTCSINCDSTNPAICASVHSCDTTSCNTYCSQAAVLGWPKSTRRHALPCPDTDNDGREDRTAGSGCPQTHGNLPWVTLGTAAQDAWGNRFQYSVTDGFANESLGFKNGDAGTHQVCTTSAGSCTTGNLAQNIPAVILSHGPNGRGATSAQSITQATPTGTDELENALTDADQRYVSRTPYKPADGSAAELAKEFDDQLVWLPANQLITRVCPAGGCL